MASQTKPLTQASGSGEPTSWPMVLIERLYALGPGLLLVAGLSLVAQVVAAGEELLFGRAWIDGLVVALLLGVAVGNLGVLGRRFDAGAAYAGKQVLEFAVVLLGAGVNAAVLSATGAGMAALIVAAVTLSLLVGFGIGRLLGLGPRLALLVATGNAICGNSAIAAMAPVIRADKSEIAAAIALTAILGVGLVLALPVLIPLLALTEHQYGVLAGMSVYAVPQVLAAALPVGPLSAEVATTVKLGRVLLLGPVVMSVGVIATLLGARGNSRPKLSAFLPWFVIGFAALAALRVTGLLPDMFAQPARAVGGWLTILAMAGLGLGVRLAAIRTVGPAVAATVLLSLAFMVGLTLILIRILQPAV